MIRLYIAIASFLAFHGLQAQELSEKEIKKHNEKVTKSREKGKNLQSLDTLFASGKPYCIMKPVKKVGFAWGEYSIRPLRINEEVMYLNLIGEGPAGSTTYFWDLSFLEHGKKIRFAQEEDMEDLIVKYDLLNDSALNISGMNKLLLVKGESPINASGIKPKTTNAPTLTERNRNGMIMVMGNKILQSNVHIGNISSETVTEKGSMFKQMTITFTDGNLVAVAKNGGITDHNWNLTTAKDNETHSIRSSLGKDDNDVIKYLIDNLYL